MKLFNAMPCGVVIPCMHFHAHRMRRTYWAA